ncbi:hypothetical protein CPB84DRAFT_1854011 [Gymnopilus junonius]|uniref:HAM1-like N-terminal domain-containing protein n=1 Tax=Gymnopilus junonius TaxID=109634 RepID=A0A9P5N7X3_GYMJU|nr:hypothetical protein CPB84DRAFT_1854011 [Gymnopilus junonius]
MADAINTLIDNANRDEALKQWFEALDYLTAHANKLQDFWKQFYEEKYGDHFVNSIGNWFKAMGDNPQFGEDWAHLTRVLLFNSTGRFKFKPNLWNDIRKVILPTLIDQVG